MALVHTMVLKPRAVIADAFRRFRARPGALWVVGAATQLPNLRAQPASSIPTDTQDLERYLQTLPSAQDLQAQLSHATKVGIFMLLLSALAWPVVALLTQGVPARELFGLAFERVIVAARAFALALVGVAALTVALMLPTLVVYAMNRPPNEPWGALPGIEAMGFWLVATCNVLMMLLFVSLVLGALMVVPAEACAQPDAAMVVLRRSFNMCRAYLFPITVLITWLALLFLVASVVTSACYDSGALGCVLGWVLDGALATIAPLCGASLHKALSENVAATRAV